MRNIERESKIFIPLLKQFCADIAPLNLDKEFPSLFIPQTMSRYEDSPKKVFFFGRDTNRSYLPIDLMECYNKNNLEAYIYDNHSLLNEDFFLWETEARRFWLLVLNLHLRLKGINEYMDIIWEEFSNSEFIGELNDFGHGNTNAIQVKQTLQQNGVWSKIDIAKYLVVKEKSSIFDRLIHTIKAYQPDLVFIFDWSSNYEQFLEGLEYTIEKRNVLNGYFFVINLKKYPTRIIWTIHPRSLPQGSLNKESVAINNLIDIIISQL